MVPPRALRDQVQVTLARAVQQLFQRCRNANEMVTNVRCYVWHLSAVSRQTVIISFAFLWISARVHYLT